MARRQSEGRRGVSNLAQVPNRPAIVVIAERIASDKETARLNYISDPKNEFHYSICADGKCNLKYPISGVFSNLRGAIDYVMEWAEKRRLKQLEEKGKK